jgi:hypothetical protein
MDVRELLYGLRPYSFDVIAAEVSRLREEEADRHVELVEQNRGLVALLQREFAALLKREQEKPETSCPAAFALRPVGGEWKRRLIGQNIELQLYCQFPGHWHPTAGDGLYTIHEPARWIQALAPYLDELIKALKLTIPLAGPLLGMTMPNLEEVVKHDIDFMDEITKIIPEIDNWSSKLEAIDSLEGESPLTSMADGSSLRVLRNLLDSLDPAQRWGGLQRVLTPEGHYLWLCDHHAKAVYPSSPPRGNLPKPSQT